MFGLTNHRLNTSDSDREIWKHVTAGDKSAFGMIYQRHVNDLFRYGMTVKPDSEFIGDSIQELFIDLWHFRDRLTGIDQLKSYLLRSLRNKIYKKLDHLNRSLKVNDSFLKENIQKLPSHEEVIIDLDSRKDESNQLVALINTLPVLQREAIMLIFFEEKSYEETSIVMEKSVQSIYTLVSRGITKLRKSFGS